MSRLLRWFIILITFLYISLFLAYQLAWVSPWAAHHTLHLIQALEIGLYLPIPILLIFLLFTSRRFLLFLSIPILVFGYHYGQLFLPKATVFTPSLRVMTWNILFSNQNMHGILHAIEYEHPDIIALQELSKPQSYVIASTLQSSYPYQLLRPSEGASGLGLLSRYPIIEEFPEKRDGLHCRCQHVIIALEKQNIEVINIHPHIPYIDTRMVRGIKLPVGLASSTQQETFDALEQRIQQRRLPLLVLGDLNTTERQQAYFRLRLSLGDAFREAGWGLGLTFPQNFRLRQIPIPAIMRLDYILHSSEWHAYAAWTNTESDADKALGSGSDHAYVVAELSPQSISTKTSSP